MMRVGLLMIIIFSAFRSFGGEGVLKVRSQAVVYDKMITLGDLADFHLLPKSVENRISKIKLSEAPKNGEVRVFSSVALSQILRQAVKNIETVKIVLPNQTRVIGASARLSPESVKAQIITGLAQSCGDCKVEVVELQWPENIVYNDQMLWSLVGDLQKARGSFQIGLEIYNLSGDLNGEPNGKKNHYWLSGRTRIMAKVPVAKRNLMYNQNLREEDVEWVMRDITQIRDGVAEIEDLTSAYLRQSVAYAQILLKTYLVKTPLVTRGKMITLQFHSDKNWTLSARGVVQESGYLGDQVKVLNPDTKKVVVGVVKSNELIEVQ